MLRLLLLVPLFVGCATQQNYGSSAARYNATEGKSLKTHVIWSKNKGDAVDMMVRYLNEYDYEVVVKNVTLETAGVKVGPLDAAPIELQPGQTMEKVFIFRLAGSSATQERKAVLSFPVFKTEGGKVGASLPTYSQAYQLCPSDNITGCSF